MKRLPRKIYNILIQVYLNSHTENLKNNVLSTILLQKEKNGNSYSN